MPNPLLLLVVGNGGGCEEEGREGAGHPGLEEPLTLGGSDDGVGVGVGVSDDEGGGNEVLGTGGVEEDDERLELGGGDVPFDRFPPPKTNSEAFAQNATSRLTFST